MQNKHPANALEPITSWQQQLADSITDPEELFEVLQLDKKYLAAAKLASKCFSLRVPRNFVAKMRTGDIGDPLLRQILPLEEETVFSDGYSSNPLKEDSYNKFPGMLHKYAGRVLLTITGGCGINCRYCFRRDFPYRENNPGKAGWQSVIDYIATDTTISEVIYSGGDPLLATDDFLAHLTAQLGKITHLKRLRIHSRLPIVVPERVTTEFLKWLSNERWQSVVVLHCNHPREIDEAVASAVKRMKDAGITVLNQAVILKGVNDSVETQVNLSNALFAAGILPYYLHLLDKVQGAAHFDLEEKVAQQIWWSMSQQLPGYLVPRLVREIPGENAKTPVPPLVF